MARPSQAGTGIARLEVVAGYYGGFISRLRFSWLPDCVNLYGLSPTAGAPTAPAPRGRCTGSGAAWLPRNSGEGAETQPRARNVKPKPVLLAIFDGFGLNPTRAHNAWALARTPHLDHYFASCPHTALQAFGRAVGLPDGQFGNSEVGHLTLGSGRVLEQDLMRIADAIYDGSLASNAAWRAMLEGTHRLHLVGMVSDGGVHSHIEHLLGILDLLRRTARDLFLLMAGASRPMLARSGLPFPRRRWQPTIFSRR
jgi:hypothetical protein